MHPLPSPWVGLVVGLAAYRLVRLGGWDDWPPIYKLRAWIIGERWIPTVSQPSDSQFPRPEMQEIGQSADDLGLPGKQPDSEVDGVRPAYERPLLAHLVHCPYCLGWWISLLVYVCWLVVPTATLYIAAPFALSAFVGLTAKNLDP